MPLGRQSKPLASMSLGSKGLNVELVEAIRKILAVIAFRELHEGLPAYGGIQSLWKRLASSRRGYEVTTNG